MDDRARCGDCKWFGGLVWITQKAVCKKNAELVRPHWLACGGFEEKGMGEEFKRLADEEPSFIAEIH